jgi:hypothetical protein
MLSVTDDVTWIDGLFPLNSLANEHGSGNGNFLVSHRFSSLFGFRRFSFGLLQAQEARMREQETEKQERARLEEILTMCAEYERQAQCERQQSKPPSTPTLHQNR